MNLFIQDDRSTPDHKREKAKPHHKVLILLVFFLFGNSLGQMHLTPLCASSDLSNNIGSPVSDNQPSSPEHWYKRIEAQWGGQVKVQGSVSWPDDESFYQPVGTGPFYDGNAELRLKNELFFEDWAIFDTHYDLVLLGGDMLRKGKELEGRFPDILGESNLLRRPLEDDRRVMNLTRTIEENDDYILYHRLDRLALSLLPKWGMIRIGRQAVTWGNGFLFNPMDLFNPFSPTDVERDYKVGDDLIAMRISSTRLGDCQFLYVPRRDPTGRAVEWEENSLAGKLHVARGTTEFDIMGAKHFKDFVVGFGSSGYLKNAAWRLDATWTFLDEDSESDDYLTLVANLDYSWVWWGKNFYGFIEFFYNGLGEENYAEALVTPDIAERLSRGELFVLGRKYLSGHIRVELHPLLNVFVTVINNLGDPSGVLQPRATWDVANNFELTFGGSLFFGANDTEFGGFKLPDSDLLITTPTSAYLWLTYYF